MALPATDLFNDTNADVALVGWTQQESPDTVKQDGLGLAYINAGTDEHVFWPLATDTFAADQYSSVILDAISGVARVSVRAKDTTPTTLDYYAATSDGDLVLCSNGTISTLLNTATTFVAGDVLRCEVVGTRIEGFKNGVSFGSATDSTLTSGQAGFGGDGNVSGTWFRSWTGGNMGGGIVAFSTGTRRVGNQRGPYDQRGFLKQTQWAYPWGAPANPITVVTDVGSLVLTGIAPTLGTNLITSAGSLTLSGFAPVLGTSIPTVAGSLILTGLSPVLGMTIPTGTGALILTGISPLVSIGTNIVTDVGSLVLTGIAPVLGGGIVTSAGLLTLSGFSPKLDLNIPTALGQLILSGFAPRLDLTVPTAVGQLILSGQAPSLGQLIATGVGSLVLTGFSPTISTGVPHVEGVTRDSSGAPLASCTIHVFRAADDVLIASGVSDGGGNFSIAVVNGTDLLYLVAYKSGAPDVAGTTQNTITGA